MFSELSDDQALADHLRETYVDDFYEVLLSYEFTTSLHVASQPYAPHVNYIA